MRATRLLTAPRSREHGGPGHATSIDHQAGLKFTSGPTVTGNPHPSVPLAAVVQCSTNRPAVASVRVEDGQRAWSRSFGEQPAVDHELPLLGLRPGRTHRIRVIVRVPQSDAVLESDWLDYTPPPLPDGFPPLRVTVSNPSQMEPGVTLFNVFQWVNNDANENVGLIVAVDESGDVIWYYRIEHPVSDVRRLSNGNLLYLRAHRSQPWTSITEIDMLGRVVQRWSAAGRVAEPLPNSVPVEVDTFHHNAVELPSGHLLALSTELRRLNEYRTSESDRFAPRASAQVVGDVIVEFRRDGSIVNRLPLLDLLNPYRIGYGSLGGFWNMRVYREVPGGTRDWSHANSLQFVPADDSLIVSLRHQDAVVKIDRKRGTIRWILGNHEHWGAKWKGYLLNPVGHVEWPYHQHAPLWSPDGRLVLFDNGDYRATPFEEPMPAEESYSRVVEYRIDEDAKTVEQTWEYRGEAGERFYSPLFGDVDRLPHTGNLLITDGGRVEDRRGQPTNDIPGDRQWARVFEITRTKPAKKVFELVVDEQPGSRVGWSIYRAERLPSLYADER